MAKVFRLHKGKGKGGSGWFDSGMFTQGDLSTIKTTGKEVATSIPSPFAQIDLVKTAFDWVAKNGLKGKTAYHKLVSDALDVAQLFYSYNKYKGKIRIETWRPFERFEKLQNASSDEHRKFSKTLQLFWEEDAKIYNFKKDVKFHFLINRLNGKVIGATSPATFFMGAPDLRDAATGLNIHIGDDVLFDDNESFSLPDREPSFVEYFFALVKQNPVDFDLYFKEVSAYIRKVLDEKKGTKTVEIYNNLSSKSIEKYPECPVLNNPNTYCELFGFRLGLQQSTDDGIEKESDFLIGIDKGRTIKGKLPLVLPCDNFTHKWTYTTKGIVWPDEIKVPCKNDSPPEKSVLPQQRDVYPWLSRDNFLTDKLIKLPYRIDEELFETCGGGFYLLPLTDTFFKYFSVEHVRARLEMFTLSGGGVKVLLKIPVKKGFIHFEKIYHAADIISDRGDTSIYLAILPFFKVPDKPLLYTIGVIDDREREEDLHVLCYSRGREISLERRSRTGQADGYSSVYYKYKEEGMLDVLRIKLGEHEGVVVPKLMDRRLRGKDLWYAVDFGTTNTHIEYAIFDGERQAAMGLDTSPGIMWNSLEGSGFSPIAATFERELFPHSFGDGRGAVKFPVRTALSFNANVDFHRKVSLFLDANMYMLYEKKVVPRHLDIKTHLKWAQHSDESESRKVAVYIESILYLLYLKALSEGASPEKVHIIWFFPASMSAFDRGKLEEIWREGYKRVFGQGLQGGDLPLSKMSESVAPVFYYTSQAHVAGITLSIDIGGGTSDFAFFDGANEDGIGLPSLISSVRFAGDVIWGDGYAGDGNIQTNGYVKAFRDRAEAVLPEGSEEKMILRDILSRRKRAEDFNSFLFSLGNHLDSDIEFDYGNYISKHEALKLPILLFFGALGYYIAKLTKASGTKSPGYITLSGMGSKASKIIDPSLMRLSGLFQFFYEWHGCSIETEIEMRVADNPKTITCKGALERACVGGKGAAFSEDDKLPSVFWLGGEGEGIWEQVLDKTTNIQNIPLYGEVRKNEAVRQFILSAIGDFYIAMDEYVKRNRISDFYGISLSAYNVFQKMRDRDIDGYLQRGIGFFGKSDDDAVEDSLFFYPLRGIINKLTYELVTKT